MWLARIEIKEVTHDAELRRVYSSRLHVSAAIIVTFLVSSYRPSF